MKTATLIMGVFLLIKPLTRRKFKGGSVLDRTLEIFIIVVTLASKVHKTNYELFYACFYYENERKVFIHIKKVYFVILLVLVILHSCISVSKLLYIKF
jgi:hypothetical protein